jgi:non-heme chloroperoxidase
LERLVAQSLKAPARVWKSALEGLLGFDDAAELGRIVAPTLLLWGERDGLFSREEQERLAAVIPRASLQVVPETGHSPHLERPERVVDDLDAFLRAA